MEIIIKVISAKKLTRLLGAVIIILVLADIIGQISKIYWDHRSLCGFVGLFDGEQHGGVPHWFKAMLMLIISVTLFFIYLIQKSEQSHFKNHWLFLSLGVFLMNIIQSADIHNALSPCIRSALGAGGWFYFAWVIPGMVIVMVVGLLYLHFFIKLPPRMRFLFFLAGLIYVIGAIGFEMATSYYYVHYGMDNFGYAGLSAIHEALKMVGLVIFIYPLMDFLESKRSTIKLFFSKGSEELG